MRSGHFDRDQQGGEWTTYDQQGKVCKVTRFKPKAKKPAARTKRSALGDNLPGCAMHRVPAAR